MKITELSIWEELGGLQGWSELAASCDASPFAWPSFCLPWWWELGWGRLASVAVEDSGLLVGLALIHDRVGDVGRHMLRFVGDEVGTYHQLLVAEDRDDVCEILLERILSSGREIDFSSIPLKLAHSYQAATSCPLVLTEQTTFGFVSVPVESPEPVSTDRIGQVRKVTDPAECLALITGPTEADRGGGGAPGSKMAAFFASAVDASARAGRMTLHIADRHDGPTSGLLMVHGSRTSVVWRHVGGLPLSTDALVRAATEEAFERGSQRVLWPESSRVSGQPFPLVDLKMAHTVGRFRAIPGLARGAVRGIRDYLSA